MADKWQDKGRNAAGHSNESRGTVEPRSQTARVILLYPYHRRYSAVLWAFIALDARRQWCGDGVGFETPNFICSLFSVPAAPGYCRRNE